VSTTPIEEASMSTPRSALPSLLLAATALIVCVLLASGCATTTVPDAPPSIRGVVTSVEPGEAGSGSIRVVWTEDPAVGARTEQDAAQVAITPETELLRRVGEGTDATYESIEFAQLEAGDVVEVWFEGPVAESYPVQANGDVLAVIGSYTGELPTPPGLEPEPAP
jgi:hypothetical protein